MDGPLTDMVGQKEASLRPQHAKYFTEGRSDLFRREVNESIEGHHTSQSVVFKFKVQDIPSPEENVWMTRT